MKRSLTKPEILRSSADIRRVFRNGSAVSHNKITVFTYPQDNCHSRIIAVVRKPGNAVTRNLGRRRIKELFRLMKPLFTESFDMAIVITRPIPSFSMLSGAVQRILSRKHLILQE